jgi:hypothetical protein
VGSKDKKIRAAALREFLVAMPVALERVTASLGWLVVLGVVALGALLLHLMLGGGRHPPMPGMRGANAVAALYVRDLGRLSDGRHTFDLVYDVTLAQVDGGHDPIAFSIDRLVLGDAGATGDVAEMGHAPGLFDDPAARRVTGGIAWRVVAQSAVVAGACGPDRPSAQAALETHHLISAGPVNCAGGLVGDGPGAHSHQAHYRIAARVDQLADVAVGFGTRPPPHGWFGAHHDDDPVRQATAIDEEVQLGAVVRTHCPLGVKVVHGEVRALCGV